MKGFFYNKVRDRDVGTKSASNELAVTYSQDKEFLCSPQPKEELRLVNNSEIKGIAETLQLSDGPASEHHNEEHTIVEHMMSVSNSDISNIGSKKLGISYIIDKEVDRPPQHEVTEKKGIEIFPLSYRSASKVQNGEQTIEQHRISIKIKDIDDKVRLSDGSASKLQNEEKTIVEHTMSVSNPDICNNGSKEFGIAYIIDKEVDRLPQHGVMEIKVINEIYPLSDGSASNIQNEEHTIVEQMMSVSSPDISKDASNELGIACSIDKEVDQPPQHEAHFTSTTILRIDQEKEIKDIWRTTTSALKNEAVKVHAYLHASKQYVSF
ncbi:hypothetical protein CHS0354_009730 [Potamilus streckersoni]|uniref:Uncharacterized protein n=1 Tax=Potamilus streckersoni TaxID=2493646 RepID=A0AAE0S0L8_9BIVA|nr:hypothetical protein CHS0354_009730 [Potamilus streckersoni]